MSGAELNEYHADFLARDRLAEARAAAARRDLVHSVRPHRRLRAAVGLGLIRLGRRLARGDLPTRPARGQPDGAPFTPQ